MTLTRRTYESFCQLTFFSASVFVICCIRARVEGFRGRGHVGPDRWVSVSLLYMHQMLGTNWGNSVKAIFDHKFSES